MAIRFSRASVSALGFALAAAVSIVAGSAARTAGPQVGNPQAQASPPATALILGRVIDATTNTPLAGVTVTLSGTLMRPRRVIVDPQGRFIFSGLPAGAFTIAATKTGFLPGSYGTLRPDGSGRPLELRDGERLTDTVVRLWRYAAISGVVSDDAGDPVSGARVQVLKRTIVAGRWKLVNGNQGADADERGAYRVTGLLPGDYALVITSMASAMPASLMQVADAIRRLPGPESSALMSDLSVNGTGGYANDLMQRSGVTRVGDLLLQGSGNAIVSADGLSIETYPTTWYPGVAMPADAALVSVSAGDDRAGIDLHPTLTKTRRVSGTVVGPLGPVAHLALRLVPSRLDDATAEITSSLSLSLTTSRTATDVNGAFTFVGVPAGQFIIRAVTSPRPPVEPPPPSGQPPRPLVPTDPTLWTATAVSVGDNDTSGVVVTLRGGLRVTGRVEFAGAAARPSGDELRGLQIVMDPADGRWTATSSAYRAQIDSSGRFYTIGLVAGRYLLRMDRVPRGWTLKSALLGGRDICDVPLALVDADMDGLVLTFTDRPSTIAGSVRTAQGRPDEDAMVLVFPADSGWTDLGTSPRRLRGIRASRTGAFSTAGLPAGDYYVMAVSDAVASNWQDPVFLQKLARAATKVTLGDGQSLSLSLTTTEGIAR